MSQLILLTQDAVEGCLRGDIDPFVGLLGYDLFGRKITIFLRVGRRYNQLFLFLGQLVGWFGQWTKAAVTTTLTTPPLDRPSCQIQHLSRRFQSCSRGGRFINEAENLLPL